MYNGENSNDKLLHDACLMYAYTASYIMFEKAEAKSDYFAILTELYPTNTDFLRFSVQKGITAFYRKMPDDRKGFSLTNLPSCALTRHEPH